MTVRARSPHPARLCAAVAVTAALAFGTVSPADATTVPAPGLALSEFSDPAAWQAIGRGGATAAFSVDTTRSTSGGSSGRFDVSAPGAGTAELVSDLVDTPSVAIEFDVRSTDIDTIAVRAFDGTGQVHQQRIALDPSAPGWQHVRIDSFDSGTGYSSWNGAADGVWHGPLTRLSIVVDRWGALDGASSGSLWIDALRGVADAPGGGGGRVLFVGNSFTHGFEDPALSYNSAAIDDRNGGGVGGVPGIFDAMTTRAGLQLDVEVEAASGQTLAWHRDTRGVVLGERWDTVVLQEQSTLPLPTAHGGQPAVFREAAEDVLALVASGNAQAESVLYETWASPSAIVSQGYPSGVAGLSAMQADLDAEFSSAASALGFSESAPVGDAFLRAVTEGIADGVPGDGIAPGTARLWSAQDERHASAVGSYLAAAVLVATLTGIDPRTLPTGPGSVAADLGIAPALAVDLHDLAAG
ncbi:hypothetical protein [Rathayibacter sp. Leaf296]|uniref:hypothetical protein n=1 Tax=Rathayibacter sp. Leaf296 TaxID=1736327 RepID=UPI0007039649|nr:hypothetical protein [Rathayibacter sp. Leaf296]KQQ08265.1 hypothetical protein ASF46_13125 [Rathayibacter sp. Leaf296]